MSGKNMENASDNNYSITDRSRPQKKRTRILGRLIALVISLMLALLLRYYVDINLYKEADTPSDLFNIAAVMTEQTL